MSDNRDIIYSVFLFGFGILSFFKGFMRLRRKRLIENTPTSTVRGLAMGLVELSGKVQKIKPLKSPLTETECVFYKYKVERYESSGRSGNWVVIVQGDSNYCPFRLDDGTGSIMVFPEGAELIIPIDYQFQTRIGKTMPDNLISFMESNGLKYSGLFGNHNLRFSEWFITSGENVYVLGTTQKTSDPLDNHKQKLIQRLDQLKADSNKMLEVDLNKDGIISDDEWIAAVKKIEQGLLEEELKSTTADNEFDVIIGKDPAGQVFIISDRIQSQVIKGLSWDAFLGVFGGAVLSLAMLVYLLYRLGKGL